MKFLVMAPAWLWVLGVAYFTDREQFYTIQRFIETEFIDKMVE
jgi:hypothetical protein